ncbi:MAG: hypothetical protein ACWGOX_09255, partial [Desulforhopalus sp.]
AAIAAPGWFTMDEKKQPTQRNHTPCPWCNGSGQTSFFSGESRFMFTWEDCPDCSGTGVVVDRDEDTPKNTNNKTTK